MPENSYYLPRYLDEEISSLVGGQIAIAIDGPKGVGKTETASRYVDLVLKLDVSETRQLIELDLSAQLKRAQRICIDEWQKYPPVWDAVRRMIDEKTGRQYLLTGSASPVAGVDTHSGAGRFISLRMRPMALSERHPGSATVKISDLFSGSAVIGGETTFGAADYAEEICASGFPGIRTLAPRHRRMALEGYLTRIIDRDIPELGGSLRSPASLRAWMTAYAAATSTVATYTTILDAAIPGEGNKPAKSTSYVYRDLLTQLWILDPVEPWLPSFTPLKRLGKAAKHQLCDPALSAALLGITPDKLMSGAPGTAEYFGQLFEALATLTIRAAGQESEARIGHLRTRGGAQEVDLVLERYDGSVLAFEVKLAKTIHDADVRHLNTLKEQLGDRLVDRIVITAGGIAYRRPDGVGVVPLALLG